MPIIRITAEGQTARPHQSAVPLKDHLTRADSNRGPVVVLIHGYKYAPGHHRHCPHRSILSENPERGRISWPRQLGFGTGDPQEGLAISFAWQARGPLWHARQRAVEAGYALAELLSLILVRHPHRPIHLVGHSMGIEVACAALHHLPLGAIRRVLSLTGASYQSRVHAALASPAGQSAEFFNITSRENDAFDLMYEWLVTPAARGDRALGYGVDAPNAVNLQLDCPITLSHLARLGARIPPQARRICHWSTYTRQGAMAFYNDLLRDPDRLSLGLLSQGLPERPAPHWSRLLEPPKLPCPLPSRQKLA